MYIDIFWHFRLTQSFCFLRVLTAFEKMGYLLFLLLWCVQNNHPAFWKKADKSLLFRPLYPCLCMVTCWYKPYYAHISQILKMVVFLKWENSTCLVCLKRRRFDGSWRGGKVCVELGGEGGSYKTRDHTHRVKCTASNWIKVILLIS